MQNQHPNIKFVDPPKSAYRAKPPKGCLILFLAANPKDAETLSLTKEFNAVQENCPHDDDEWDLSPRFDMTPGKLLPLLLPDEPGKEASPKILHFSGHGTGSNGLMFTDESGYSQLVTGVALAEMLQNFSDSISCVVLNACYSDEQARTISKYIPNVIGTDNAIGDDKAIEFSEAFYLCLFRGESYENAFRMALAHVGIQNLSKGAQPIFYRWKATAMANEPEVEVVAVKEIEKKEVTPNVEPAETKTTDAEERTASSSEKRNPAALFILGGLVVLVLVLSVWGYGVLNSNKNTALSKGSTEVTDPIKISGDEGKIDKTNVPTFDQNMFYSLSSLGMVGKSLSVFGDGTDKWLYMADITDSEDLHWKLRDLEDGYFRLTCKRLGSEKSISISDGMFHEPQLHTSKDIPEQRWQIKNVEGGFYRVTNEKMGEGFALGVNIENTRLTMTKAMDKSVQKWKIDEVK